MANANVKRGIVGFGVVMIVVLVIFALRIDVGYPVIGLLGILAVFLLLAPVMIVKRTVAVFKDGRLEVKGSNIDYSIPVGSIRTFEFRDKITVGNAVEASSNGWMAGGVFRNKEFGDYHLCADVDLPAFIVVRFSGDVLVFNLKTVKETRALFDAVKASIPEDTRRR